MKPEILTAKHRRLIAEIENISDVIGTAAVPVINVLFDQRLSLEKANTDSA
jgi:hypothetical protein